MDIRIKKLAKNIVNYSCNIKSGENVLINCNGTSPIPLVKEIIKEIYNIKAYPFVEIRTNDIEREILMGITKTQAEIETKFAIEKMKNMDAFIGISGEKNNTELYDVPTNKIEIFNKYYQKPVHYEIRVPKTKWVILKYPCSSMAQSAKMSIEGFENYYFNVCNIDYNKMSKAMDSIINIMNTTDKIKIIGKNTDISFSIKNMPIIKCDGKCNLPDGEVYTAPIKDSVNGKITYNIPSEYNGFTFENISLTFKNGKIINATANDTKRINKIFDTDKGARYIGEFAIGLNPYINKPMNNILFDEKIAGSLHLTPGNCYNDANNGNISSIHWDLVLIQTPEFGGGEMYFDNKLIRKDGKFIIPELECLNIENLI